MKLWVDRAATAILGLYLGLIALHYLVDSIRAVISLINRIK